MPNERREKGASRADLRLSVADDAVKVHNKDIRGNRGRAYAIVAESLAT